MYTLSYYSEVTSDDKYLLKALPLQPLGLQDVEAPRISRQSAHEGGKGCWSYAPATFTTQEIMTSIYHWENSHSWFVINKQLSYICHCKLTGYFMTNMQKYHVPLWITPYNFVVCMLWIHCNIVRDFRFLPQSNWELCSSGLLCS
jgi:hypothetical protein